MPVKPTVQIDAMIDLSLAALTPAKEILNRHRLNWNGLSILYWVGDGDSDRIVAAFSRHSGKSEQTLHPVFRRLEKEGFLVSLKVKGPGGRGRGGRGRGGRGRGGKRVFETTAKTDALIREIRGAIKCWLKENGK